MGDNVTMLCNVIPHWLVSLRMITAVQTQVHISGDILHSSSSKFYFQQNTTMEQYQEKENTL